MRTRTKAGLAIASLAILAAIFFSWLRLQKGFSAREQPSAVEEFLARNVRSWSLPASAREMTNPAAASEENLADARAHFADHCAFCHANDGSGNTDIGRGLYPKPPDLRQSATQSLSDGELVHIIHNGIRLTGMPGFGNGPIEEDEDSWKLVHFIRHLPRLTKEELEEMERLNPHSEMETKLTLEEEIQQFLRGEESRPQTKKHQH